MYDTFNNYIKEDAAILQKVILPDVKSEIEIYIKRENLIHPVISGNKWRKLKYNLIEAKKQKQKTLLTFGGAYSNHIHALSEAGKLFGFNTIGIIRGEEHLPLNPTLKDAVNNGMLIHYVSRENYRKKNEPEFLEKLKNKFDKFYLVPEGGTNSLAVKGCTEIIKDIKIDYDYIISACGTGGTISGIICGLGGNKKVIGIPVLKGAGFLHSDVFSLVKNYSSKEYDNWELNLNYHFGGYAKINSELIDFMLKFEEINKIQLEPIYTAKMLYGLKDLINKNKLKNDSIVIAIHSGGLQGRRGMLKKINTYNSASNLNT